jgi:hypothetical protein
MYKWSYRGTNFLLEGEEIPYVNGETQIKVGFPGKEYEDTIYRGISIRLGFLGRGFVFKFLF